MRTINNMKTNEINKNEEALAKAARKYQKNIESNNPQAEAWDFYGAFIAGATWRDKQPIMESDGWHTEEPTENGWYLVDTPDFPKNCECVVAEWDNDAKHFYDEHSDYPIKFHRWKLIERG